jgi:16S rRNA (cytosine1402-N4)-methyltransferase
MLEECLEGLNIRMDGIYVDGTLGGAGHSSEIAKRLGVEGLLIGIDKDLEAIEASKKRLAKNKNRLELVNDDFKNYKNIIESLNIEKVDGILLDLGISSYQIDNAERGFSYMKEAKLDMRMNKQQSLSAYEVVNEYKPGDLVRILFTYGEEKFSRQIVKNIIKAREIKPIETTLELSEIIRNSLPAKVKFKGGHPAKKTFQAIRIEVNSELSKLGEVLRQMVNSLRKDGRIAVITFHSLEDRIVKNVFKEFTVDCICPVDFPICICDNRASLKLINRKPIIASEEEKLKNTRSKSAKLRVAKKLI